MDLSQRWRRLPCSKKLYNRMSQKTAEFGRSCHVGCFDELTNLFVYASSKMVSTATPRRDVCCTAKLKQVQKAKLPIKD